MKTDIELKREVEDELLREPTVHEAHVGVSVKGGVATPTGHVPSYPEKYGAERAAKRVPGVRAVADELDVRLPDSGERTNEDIAADCLAALKTRADVPKNRVKVVVDGGWVTLEGAVESQEQKGAAETAVRGVPGILGVSNNVAVEPHHCGQPCHRGRA